MTRTDISARAPFARGGVLRGLTPRGGVRSWMAAAFLVSLALAAVTLAGRGAGEPGTAAALRLTGRWMFVLFWPAYAGGAAARLFGPRLDGLARRGRAFGLAFASALAVHIALVLWLLDIAADARSPMVVFWSGAACAWLLALSSSLRLRERLGPFLWRLFCTAALECIALAFAIDFIYEPLHAADFGAHGFGAHGLIYVPFAAMLVGGATLRLAAFARRRPALLTKN